MNSKNSKYKKLLISLIILILSIGLVYAKGLERSSETYKNKLIRLHVVANSDSKEDQDLKLKVRDEIIAQMNDSLKNSDSIDTTRKIVSENIDNIKYIALKEVKANNKEYEVAVWLDNFNFPTKSYGDFTLPAGEYQALKVVIGEGKGQNWWCVMFPPLCFIDITNGLTTNTTIEELKKALSEEEFKSILNAKEEEAPILLKSKLVELYEKGKIQFAKIFVADKQ
ncbi:stage II sporulation protein R [Proteiniborus ethanoligenes]|uniref:Stage II sporulation protein R n=1 Tax=Proteiniborus ethanoligenes TaxID=415015 RepID=A0A1H3M1I0_9FIRM|nr:stage II sporulation protein R [Proteiniborus ethanoligenes]SDY70423.1 stage II sporulation protein R [Proteiniborus ethanoligenes]